MFNEQNRLAIVNQASDFLRSAKAYFESEKMISDIVEWSGIYPSDVSERELLSVVAATLELPISATHERAMGKLRKETKKVETDRNVFHEFQRSPLVSVQYEVFHCDGSHQMQLSCEEFVSTSGFYSFHEQYLVESDCYCCEMCDGERIPDERESEIPGYYVGWMISRFFVAFSTIDKQTFKKLGSYQGVSHDELTKTSLRAAMVPWEL